MMLPKLCSNGAVEEVGVIQAFDLFMYILTDLNLIKRPGTSNQIKIHFAVFNPLYILFSLVKLVKLSKYVSEENCTFSTSR